MTLIRKRRLKISAISSLSDCMSIGLSVVEVCSLTPPPIFILPGVAKNNLVF